jgi:hypothetical protein
VYLNRLHIGPGFLLPGWEKDDGDEDGNEDGNEDGKGVDRRMTSSCDDRQARLRKRERQGRLDKLGERLNAPRSHATRLHSQPHV